MAHLIQGLIEWLQVNGAGEAGVAFLCVGASLVPRPWPHLGGAGRDGTKRGEAARGEHRRGKHVTEWKGAWWNVTRWDNWGGGGGDCLGEEGESGRDRVGRSMVERKVMGRGSLRVEEVKGQKEVRRIKKGRSAWERRG